MMKAIRVPFVKLNLVFAVALVSLGVRADETRVARMRLYELKISESGTLTHDYVPAGFAGEFGLYDRKTGDFKKNV